jgi:hypothetical protein
MTSRPTGFVKNAALVIGSVALGLSFAPDLFEL